MVTNALMARVFQTEKVPSVRAPIVSKLGEGEVRQLQYPPNSLITEDFDVAEDFPQNSDSTLPSTKVFPQNSNSTLPQIPVDSTVPLTSDKGEECENNGNSDAFGKREGEKKEDNIMVGRQGRTVVLSFHL